MCWGVPDQWTQRLSVNEKIQCFSLSPGIKLCSGNKATLRQGIHVSESIGKVSQSVSDEVSLHMKPTKRFHFFPETRNRFRKESGKNCFTNMVSMNGENKVDDNDVKGEHK